LRYSSLQKYCSAEDIYFAMDGAVKTIQQ